MGLRGGCARCGLCDVGSQDFARAQCKQSVARRAHDGLFGIWVQDHRRFEKQRSSVISAGMEARVDTAGPAGAAAGPVPAR